MVEDYTLKQIEELNYLFDKTDEKMTIEDAVRFITDTPFY